MKRTIQNVAVMVLVFLCVTTALAKKMPSKTTWKDFEGTWIGYDPGTGAFFHRLFLTEKKTGTCVILLSENDSLMCKVTVISWDEQSNITLRFDPLPGTDYKPFDMERVEGVGFTLREKGVKKLNRAREVQLVREADIKRDTARAEKLAEKMK